MEVSGQPLYSTKWSKHQGVMVHGCKAISILNLSYNKGDWLAYLWSHSSLRTQFLVPWDRRFGDEQNLDPKCPIMHRKAAYISNNLIVIKSISLLVLKKLPSHPQGKNHSQQTLLQVQAQTEWWMKKKKNKKHYCVQNIIHHIKQHSNYEWTGQMCSHI